MVCQRCVMSVQQTLQRLGIGYHDVMLGEIELKDELPESKRVELEIDLQKLGFELIDSRKTLVIEKIKKAVLSYLDAIGERKRENLSTFIAAQLNYEYTYLSDLFSSVEGITIEQFFILQRIEKVKELLVYDQLTLSEIAFQLGYSSVHHLSAQFKKVTGLTPSHFKKIGATKRKSIDRL